MQKLHVFFILICREFWEHRSLLALPAFIFILLGLANGLLLVFPKLLSLVSIVPNEITSNIVLSILRTTSSLLYVIFSILIVFYLMDSLHSERQDKSILFWRSLPVSDSITVLSKLFVGVVIIPIMLLISIVLIVLFQTLFLYLFFNDLHTQIWSAVGDSKLTDYWLYLAGVLSRITLWIMPLFAWFLFCSSWTKRTPFLSATVIPIGLILIGKIVTGIFDLNLRPSLYELITERLPIGKSLYGIFGDMDFINVSMGNNASFFADAASFYANPRTWGGLVVAMLLVAATIWIRRWRDDQ